MINTDKVLSLVKKEAELETRLQMLNAEIEKEEQKLTTASTNVDLYTKCSNLLTNVSLTIQKKTTEKIAKIVTDLYQYVFLSKDTFVIQVDKKRSVPVAHFYIETTKNGKKILLDPMKDEGGGKVDVIALGLRLAALLLYRPSLERVLVLDEPLRFLSSSTTSDKPYRLRAVDFLKQVAKEYGIQVIAVTHDLELKELADKINTVHLDENGYSVVESVKLT